MNDITIMEWPDGNEIRITNNSGYIVKVCNESKHLNVVMNITSTLILPYGYLEDLYIERVSQLPEEII